MAIYANSGEWVTCSGPEHHRIAMFSKTVTVGAPQDLSNLVEWTQPQPEIGDMVPSPSLCCAKCGSPWWSDAPLPGSFHFKDGWRPRLPHDYTGSPRK